MQLQDPFWVFSPLHSQIIRTPPLRSPLSLPHTLIPISPPPKEQRNSFSYDKKLERGRKERKRGKKPGRSFGKIVNSTIYLPPPPHPQLPIFGHFAGAVDGREKNPYSSGCFEQRAVRCSIPPPPPLKCTTKLTYETQNARVEAGRSQKQKGSQPMFKTPQTSSVSNIPTSPKILT